MNASGIEASSKTMGRGLEALSPWDVPKHDGAGMRAKA